MKIREVMSNPVIKINPEESVEVAARTLAHYNIGAMPVCTSDGVLLGVVTDRDLVTRCVASGKLAQNTPVREVMSRNVVTAEPEMDVGAAAGMMGKKQIRRLPVVEQGYLCGMVSIGDLAGREESAFEATDALAEISSNIRRDNKMG